MFLPSWNLAISQSKEKVEKALRVTYERKEAVKESRQRERRSERGTRRIWVSSSYPLQTQAGTKAKERKEDGGIINAYGVAHRCASKCPPKH